MKKNIFYVLCCLVVSFCSVSAQEVIRGPYLQNPSINECGEAQMIIRWRLDDDETNPAVKIGLALNGDIPNGNTISATTLFVEADYVDYEAVVTGLSPDTKYYYSVGNTGSGSYETDLIFDETNPDDYYFYTPPNSEDSTIDIWVLGDSGKTTDDNRSVCGGSSYEDEIMDYKQMRKSFMGASEPLLVGEPTMLGEEEGFNPSDQNCYLGSSESGISYEDLDMVLMLGDNTYTYNGNELDISEGDDASYGYCVFERFEDALRNLPLFPSIGDHDQDIEDAYLDVFSLPENGVADKLEEYYSFDYGPAHFVCLNSDKENSGSGSAYFEEMARWLAIDLASTTKKWKVVYFQHPPYAAKPNIPCEDKDDDEDYNYPYDCSESAYLIAQHIVPIMEEYGVDLVLSGDNHQYQRSHLLKNVDATDPLAIGLSDDQILSNDASPIKSPSSAFYPFDEGEEDGIVYVTAGSSSRIDYNSPLDTEVMAVALREIGSCHLQISPNQLRLRFVALDVDEDDDCDGDNADDNENNDEDDDNYYNVADDLVIDKSDPIYPITERSFGSAVFEGDEDEKNILVEGTHRIDGKITVRDGENLIFKEADVSFKDMNSGLYVEPGGRLLVDETVLSGCNTKRWRGITVLGTGNAANVLSANDIVDYNPLLDDDLDSEHGIVIVKNGSIIENAQVGIHAPIASDGIETRYGIVVVDGCTDGGSCQKNIFRGNYTDIEINFGATGSTSGTCWCPSYIMQPLRIANTIFEGNLTMFSAINLSTVEGLEVYSNEFIRMEGFSTAESPIIRTSQCYGLYYHENIFNNTSSNSGIIGISNHRGNFTSNNDEFKNLYSGFELKKCVGEITSADFENVFSGIFSTYVGFLNESNLEDNNLVDYYTGYDNEVYPEGTPTQGLFVDNCTFDNVRFGITSYFGEEDEITNNIFESLSSSPINEDAEWATYPSRAITLARTKNALVQNNSVNSVSGNGDFSTIGLLLDGGIESAYPNQILGNYFKETDYGVFCQKNNELSQFRCNNFGVDGDPHGVAAWYVPTGVLGDQGECEDGGDENVANNRWHYSDENFNADSDIDFRIDSGEFMELWYSFAGNPSGTGYRLEPTLRSPKVKFFSESGNDNCDLMDESCSDILGFIAGGGDIEGIIDGGDSYFTQIISLLDDKILELEDAYTALETDKELILFSLDDGNTVGLMIDINDMSQSQVELVGDLLGIERFSIDILKELIDRWNPLSSSNLKEVLLGQAPYSKEVIKAIEERSQPISTSAYNEIMEAHFGVPPKENEETIKRRMRRNRQKARQLEHEKLRLLKAKKDTAGMVDLWSQSKFIEMKQELLEYYLEQETYDEAKAVLEGLNLEIVGKYHDLMKLFIDVREANRNTTVEEINLIKTISNSKKEGQLQANLFLSSLENKLYFIPTEEKTVNKRAFVPDDELLKEQIIEISPNPAPEFISIRSNQPKEGLLYVYDNVGKLVTSMTIERDFQINEIEVNDWSNGVYLYEFMSKDNKILDYGKFIVQH